ncbi:hypothetical protein OAT56_01865 [Amylibacter sp.]|jgi:hypothetical protein|nr:hypothetical protein [Amylibacter sp.]MDA9374499.1 hypothetical protein [bacterium]MDA9243183.1 hypothetical protein [Amylibacter sp.]MDA9313446.1 hypothetical protein [Amylibacter sp.]MDB0032955.1 hypothetical protein [Amylibacter sp.]|tara:strand:+ start:805 stop:1056 length:252 start_codon:yes stop_codon:yes gene_type:complete
MNKSSSAERDVKRRKLRKITELSLGIPILAICLLVSPLLNGFTGNLEKVNFTSVIFYIFGAWGIFIILAFIMAKLLKNDLDTD